MKKQKLLSLLLALCMSVSNVAIPVSADEASQNEEVNQPAAGENTSRDNAVEMSLDEKIDVSYTGKELYYKFVPDTDGKYLFCSLGDSDTKANLLDENSNQISEDDDGGTVSNFKIEYNLEAGKTYYLSVSAWSEPADFTICVVKGIDLGEFVEDAPDLELATDTAVSIDTLNDFYYEKAYALNVEETGVYRIALAVEYSEYADYKDAELAFFDESLEAKTEMNYDINYQHPEDGKSVYLRIYTVGLNAGETTYLLLERGQGLTDVTLQFSKYDMKALNENEPKEFVLSQDNKVGIAKFTTDATAYFNIFATDSDDNILNSDVNLYLYDENFEYIQMYGSYYSGYELDEDKCYYIMVRSYSTVYLNVEKKVNWSDLQKDAKTLSIPDEATEASLEIKTDKLNRFTHDEAVEIKFKESGYYQIEIEGYDNTYTSGKEGKDIAYLDDYYSSDSKKSSKYENGKYTVVYKDYFDKGDKYLGLEYENDKERSYKVTLSKYTPVQLKLGEDRKISASDGKVQFFCFTPEKDGEHVFSTTGSGGANISIYSPKHRKLDYKYGYGNDVTVKYNLYAGTTYTIELTGNSDVSEYTISVSAAKTL